MELTPIEQKYYDRYKRGGCTVDQLRKLVQLGAIRVEAFEYITGEPYEPYKEETEE